MTMSYQQLHDEDLLEIREARAVLDDDKVRDLVAVAIKRHTRHFELGEIGFEWYSGMVKRTLEAAGW